MLLSGVLIQAEPIPKGIGTRKRRINFSNQGLGNLTALTYYSRIAPVRAGCVRATSPRGMFT